MSEITSTQFIAYNNFIKTPSPKNAFDLVVSCHTYISMLASKWHQPNMTRRVKINEIITEMYLILLEDFTSSKAINCNSAFSYLDSRLKSLIYPPKDNFLVDFSKVTSSITSNEKFTYNKICMIKEIVKIIRRNLLETSFTKGGIVPFLFIHIYPKIRWISELLAKKENLPQESRYEADAKRINRFNNKLRLDFENLSYGDWHEIADWSFVERRHLAWKIINISPKEVELDNTENLHLINEWRENFNVHSEQNLDKLEIAEKVFKSMVITFPNKEKKLMAAEETELFRKPTNIIYQLIGDFYDNSTRLEEPIKNINFFDTFSENDLSMAKEDLEFMEVARELGDWFEKMLNQHNKFSIESNNWKY